MRAKVRQIDPLHGKHKLTYFPAWSAYWSPIFQSLTAQCINPCRDIRHHAVSALQRTLLSLEISSTDEKEWTAIFDQVLFPLILRLLKPEVYHSDPLGMGETRVQVAILVCKIFLRYLDQLPNRDGMLDLWLKILDILDRMMNSGQGDSLVRCLTTNFNLKPSTNPKQEEAIPESLKNILLVMADGGYLVPPSQDPSKESIWTETKKRLERFLPDLFKEIFPNASDEKSAPVSVAPSPVPSTSTPPAESQDQISTSAAEPPATSAAPVEAEAEEETEAPATKQD